MKPTLKYIPATLALVLIALTQHAANAEVRLPGFFGDHMVMQRDIELRIWGWCDAGESVTATLNGKEASTKGKNVRLFRMQKTQLRSHASTESHLWTHS